MQAAAARGVLGGTSRMGCLLRWKAGETRSPPRYVPASNCGAEEVMARTRAPWTSQNAPRMHLQSQRARPVGGDEFEGENVQSRTQRDIAGQSARVASAVTWLSEVRENEFRWRVIPGVSQGCVSRFRSNIFSHLRWRQQPPGGVAAAPRGTRAHSPQPWPTDGKCRPCLPQRRSSSASSRAAWSRSHHRREDPSSCRRPLRAAACLA